MAAFYEEGIQKLVPHYDKCLNNGGEYVENSLKNVESDNNNILYETLLDFLQRNGTCFLNKPRIYNNLKTRDMINQNKIICQNKNPNFSLKSHSSVNWKERWPTRLCAEHQFIF